MVFITQEFPGDPGVRSDASERLDDRFWPVVASASLALLTGVVLWFDLSVLWVLSWILLVMLSHGAAIALLRARPEAPHRPAGSLWRSRFSPPQLAVAGAWGALAIAIAAGASDASQIVICTAAAAIMAGGVLMPSGPVRGIEAAVWIVAAPLALASWWMSDLPHIVLAILLPLFAAGLTIASRRRRHSFAQALALRRERDRLAAELEASNSHCAAASAELALTSQRLELANDELVRARDKAEAAGRAKSEFLASMSHELRTPLNAIIGFAEVIEQETFGPAPPRYREYAGDIRGSGRHLLQVINDILDLSKVEAGQMLLHEARLDPALVMQGCVRLIKPRAAQSNVRISTTFEPRLPVLLADEARLRQIGLNLLSNAVKFTKAGGRVSISTGLDRNGGIAIAVADTGIGMSADEIAIALEPFRQVTSSLSRSNEGTGLGLPLTKNLVELHGGQLAIASTAGRGTTVTVTFPPSRSLAQPVELAV
jgi:signal transduction histidine kinase